MRIRESYFDEQEQAIADYEYSFPSSLELIELFKENLPDIIEEKIKAKEDEKKFLRLKNLISPSGNDRIANWQKSFEKAKSIPVQEIYDFKRLRRTARGYEALCPLHGDKSPSLVIYPDNHFRCFGCGKFGDGIDLIKWLFNMDTRGAVNYILKGVNTCEVK